MGPDVTACSTAAAMMKDRWRGPSASPIVASSQARGFHCKGTKKYMGSAFEQKDSLDIHQRTKNKERVAQSCLVDSPNPNKEASGGCEQSTHFLRRKKLQTPRERGKS